MNKITTEQITKFGKKLVHYGFVYSHFGNISVRVGDKLLITRSGCMLDEIGKNDLVMVDVKKPSYSDLPSSMETIVHSQIYLNTDALVIIHIHSIFAVIESIITRKNKITPLTQEDRYFLDKIPIITGKSGSKELAKNAVRALKKYKGIIIKEHGSIAIGKTLEEAYVHICSIEHSCKIKYYKDLIKI